ncbi:CorA family divalent cation transporter [Nocardioides guangzhouensis]|nr:CorA family divalent cation transporter [Nocardioides guangzhouensis]
MVGHLVDTAGHTVGLRVWYVDAQGVHPREADDVVELYAHEDGFFWIDVPLWDDDAAALLQGLGCHPMVISACQSRNYVPTVHGYEDHAFVTTQSPLLGERGHVHLLELDQIIGHHYLVTVHGPINPKLDVAEALVETEGAMSRLERGRFRPASPVELSYAITSSVARRQSGVIREVAAKLPGLEREVMDSQLRNPEELLETMFLIRHELQTTRTMAAQCQDIWIRMAEIGKLSDDADAALARDLAAQFDRVRSLADGEAQFLFGVIDLYQTKVHTKMTVAMERLAVIAAVTLPITAIASIYGMNVIVNESTHWTQLGLVLVAMLTISLLLLRWAHRQGWW